jgi:20S proteasome alpha/beta subunit
LIDADARIFEGYSIISRKHSKTTQFTQKCCIPSIGKVADIKTLHKNLITKLKIYEREHQGRCLDTESLAQIQKILCAEED